MKICGFDVPIMGFPKLDKASNMVNKVQKLAIPVVILIGSNLAMQQADAGPLTWAACMAACTAGTLGGFIPACIAACTALGLTPTP